MATGEDLGALGVVRQRQQAILGLAQAVAQGKLQLTPDADITATLAALQALPGIGAWTSNYIAMRALRWPDALVAGDVALHNALGLRGPGVAKVLTPKLLAQETERLAAAWRPFRSYAVIRAWHTLAPHYVAPTSAAPTSLAPSKASP
jgi:AraC family transcriptional regulator of adaptative response / DNA-3-methyladenine glycosylase II